LARQALPGQRASAVQQGEAAFRGGVASHEIRRQQDVATQDADRHRAGHVAGNDHLHIAHRCQMLAFTHGAGQGTGMAAPLHGQEKQRTHRPQSEQQ
jgi:hypothetical protein